MAQTAATRRSTSGGTGPASRPADNGKLKKASSGNPPALDFPAQQRPAELQVRLAISIDLPRLFELKLQSDISSKDAVAIYATKDDRRRGDFGSPERFATLVAETDGRIVGMIDFHERYDTGLSRPTLYIEDIFVESAHRKLGVGSALLAGLAARARERTISRIDLHAREDNSAARRLYRKLGFERLRSIVSVLAGPPLLDRADGAKRVLDRGADASPKSSIASSRGAEPIAFRVRFAEPEDVPRLFELKRQMATLDGNIQSMCATEDDWRRDSAGPHLKFVALVAEHAAEIIAMLTFSAHHYGALPQPALSIQDLFVQPDFRRQGIASSLIAELYLHARKAQFAHIELNIQKQNRAGNEMSRRLGFARVRHCASYSLAGSSLLQLAEAASGIVSLLT